MESQQNKSDTAKPANLDYANTDHRPWWHDKRIWRCVAAFAMLWMCWTIFQLGKPYWYRLVCYRVEQEAKTYMSIPGRVAFTHTATRPYAPSIVPNDPFFDRLWSARAGAESVYNSSAPLLTQTPIFCGSVRSAVGYQKMTEIFVGTEPTTPLKYWAVLPRSPIPTSGLECASFRILSWKPLTTKWIWNLRDARHDAYESIVQIPLLPGDALIVNGTAVDPTDQSVIDLSIVLNGQPIHLRFHMIGEGTFAVKAHGLGAADRRWSGTLLVRWPVGSTDMSD